MEAWRLKMEGLETSGRRFPSEAGAGSGSASAPGSGSEIALKWCGSANPAYNNTVVENWLVFKMNFTAMMTYKKLSRFPGVRIPTDLGLTTSNSGERSSPAIITVSAKKGREKIVPSLQYAARHNGPHLLRGGFCGIPPPAKYRNSIKYCSGAWTYWIPD
jgi:hypothetical protein